MMIMASCEWLLLRENRYPRVPLDGSAEEIRLNRVAFMSCGRAAPRILNLQKNY